MDNLEKIKLEEVNFRNSIVGDLNEADGINCPKCLNRGFITILEKGKYFVEQDCECKKARITFKRLKECGISKEVLETFTLNNFKTNEKWQEAVKKIIINYLNDGNNNWLMLSGKTGAGKTHLCISAFKDIIVNQYKRGIYISWNAEIPRLLALSKSTFTDNQEKFEARIKELSTVDVLYIDDLFKLTNNRFGDDETLSLAYRILNNRYLDKNKITIISSEFSESQIKGLDEAIWGRIHESCGNGKYWITINNEDDRNYRAR